MNIGLKGAFEKFRSNPWSIAKRFARHGWLDFLPDKTYLSVMYRASFGKPMNWDSPKTYNEKLQWLKLYDRNASYPPMVDKYEAKRYIADRVGDQFVPGVVGGPWNSFDEIDFDKLPECFVLKTTHDCGGIWICKDKSTLDVDAARAFINRHMKENYYRKHREWPYKDILPRIFAEEYLEDHADGELRDYKFFAFNGVPRMMFVASERQNESTETKFDFFDMDFHHLPIVNGHPNSNQYISKPVCFEQMKRIASILSAGMPHLRVDFYESNGQLYVGELTFFHYSGSIPFSPPEWDEIIGSWLFIPQVQKDNVKCNRIERVLRNPWRIVRILSRYEILNILPDKLYLSLNYRACFGKKMNWKTPVTFSEKLQWLKLNDRNPDYVRMVDKYEAKAFCSERIGNEHIVPLVGGPWKSAEEINFDLLPEQFVLKTNHDCGGVIICRNKHTLDIGEAKRLLNEHMRRRYYLLCREWPYKYVKPQIFAEAYLHNQVSEGLYDYKFFTFNGEPKVMYIAGGRDYSQKGFNQVYADFFDMEFNHLNLKIDHENAPVVPNKPENFDRMIEAARKLAEGTKHLRVDFYEVNGHMYIGELTFFHCGGLKPFISNEWDEILGSWINLK